MQPTLVRWIIAALLLLAVPLMVIAAPDRASTSSSFNLSSTITSQRFSVAVPEAGCIVAQIKSWSAATVGTTAATQLTLNVTVSRRVTQTSGSATSLVPLWTSLALTSSADSLRRLLDLAAEQPVAVRHALRDLQSEHAAVARTRDLASQSRRPETRAAAIEVLQLLGHAPLELLLAALDDPAPSVRIAAVRALEGIEDAAVAAALDRLLEDPSKPVRDAVRRRKMKLV